MKTSISLLFAILVCLCCNRREESIDTDKAAASPKIEFDHSKWKEKKDHDYPHRDAMLDDLISSKKLKELKYNEVLDLLGEPDRTDSLYLFYRVSQKRIYAWPIHTKTLVIKIEEDGTVQWVKIHK